MSLCGKTIYETRQKANEAIKGSHKAAKIQGKRNMGLNQVYYCDACQAWHTSSGGRRGKAKLTHTPLKEMDTIEESHKKPENKILHIKDFTGNANRNNSTRW